MVDYTTRILLVEDSPALSLLYQEYLREQPYQVEHVSTGADALAAIKQHTPDIILLDLQLPDMNGRKILDEVKQHGLHCAVIVITSHGSIDIATDIMRAGADDFLEKPFTADRLVVTLRNAERRYQLEQFVELHGSQQFRGFIGASLPMQAAYRIIKSAAASKATVFITGESGTGKEVCAQAIHDESSRCEQPFVALNCASIPKDLLESEVFGHVKGAFTGAVSAREGAAARADGGTFSRRFILSPPRHSHHLAASAPSATGHSAVITSFSGAVLC
jgi:DNA-binding NtrC family response regulator